MIYAMHKRRNPRNWRQGRDNAHRERGFGFIEKVFYNYGRIKKQLDEVKAEQGYYSAGHKDGGGSSNHAFISDPTATMAIKHCEKINCVTVITPDNPGGETFKDPEEWLFVVDKTLGHFMECDRTVYEVLRRRFMRNEHKNMTITDDKLMISEAQYYKARDEGITYARECAIQIGLIKVF